MTTRMFHHAPITGRTLPSANPSAGRLRFAACLPRAGCEPQAIGERLRAVGRRGRASWLWRASWRDRWSRLYVCAVVLVIGATPFVAAAQTRPSSVLRQLSDETQQLHEQVSASLVRMRLPSETSARQMRQTQDLLRKWEPRLDPGVRQKLVEQMNSATQHVDAARLDEDVFSMMGGGRLGPSVILLRPFDAAASEMGEQLPLRLLMAPQQRRETPRTLGIVLDDRGLVLIPAFVDRNAAGQSTLRLTLSGGEAGEASFVGSDRQTNLTLLRLTNVARLGSGSNDRIFPSPAIPGEGSGGEASTRGEGQLYDRATRSGPHPNPLPESRERGLAPSAPMSSALRPAKLADVRPADGSLVLILSPHTDAARIAVWTGGAQESGIVVLPDGRIAGFASGGQFLSAPAAAPVIRQLAEHGQVKRATLGVRVSEIRGDDPLRQQQPTLGRQPAMRVDHVFEQSPADRSGLRAGDLILSVAGESVGDLPTFAASIAARSGLTEMRVLREGQIVAVDVELIRK